MPARFLLLSLAAVVASAAFAHPGDLGRCRAIESAEERLACYDNLADRPHPAPERLVEPPAPARSADQRRPALPVEQLVIKVASVQKTPLGQLIIELANGQTWVQTDRARLALASGDEVRIRAGFGQSQYLSKTSGSRSIKVRRAE